jgi:hypothetical protein
MATSTATCPGALLGQALGVGDKHFLLYLINIFIGKFLLFYFFYFIFF